MSFQRFCVIIEQMIHHIDFGVSDLARSRAFYIRALAPLGMAAVMDIKREDGRELTGFGSLPDPVFWIRNSRTIRERLHVAFLAESRAAVDAFHRAAVEAGGRDNGGPGLRPRYAVIVALCSTTSVTRRRG
jgi:catechol 2,3-dioxygenase-like lactoylglutathione lyase family enzyme